MFNVPKRLTAKTSAAFEAEVKNFVNAAMVKHGVTGRLEVKATRGNRGVYASVQIMDSPETSKEHFALSTDLKAAGIGTAMLYGFSTKDDMCIYPMFYPLSPTVETPRN